MAVFLTCCLVETEIFLLMRLHSASYRGDFQFRYTPASACSRNVVVGEGGEENDSGLFCSEETCPCAYFLHWGLMRAGSPRTGMLTAWRVRFW